MADAVRLYLDEDAQRTSLIRALRARQIDVLTANESELVGVSDGEQLAFAAGQNRVIFTFNRGVLCGFTHNTSKTATVTPES